MCHVKLPFAAEADFSSHFRIQVAAAGDHTGSLWDFETRRKIGALRGHAGSLKCTSTSEENRSMLLPFSLSPP